MRRNARSKKWWRGVLLASLLAAAASGQTEIDLKNQTKNVDFSSATSTKPLQAGATLPGTCGVGQMFFLTSAAAGANVYACAALNTWSLEAGDGGGAVNGGTIAAHASGGSLTIGTDCSSTTPCNVGFTNRVVTLTTAAVATLGSGTSPSGIYVYVDFTTGIVTLANSGAASITCNAYCNTISGSAFPTDSFPLYVWTVTAAGGWDLFQGTFDKRAAYSTAPDGVGTNLILTAVNGKSVIAYDPTSGLTPTGAFDASGASLTRPNRVVAADPSGTCPSNQEVVLSSASGNLFSCLAGSWHASSSTGGTTAAWASASGSWIPWLGDTGTIGALAAHTVYGWEFTAPYTMTFSHIDFKESSTGSHYSLAFFNAASGALNAQSNVNTATSSTVQVTFASAVTLTGGSVYILAMGDDDGALTFYGPTNTSLAGILNVNATPRVFTCANASTGTGSLAFPSTCGVRTASALDPPLVAFLF